MKMHTNDAIRAMLTGCSAEEIADLYHAADNAGYGEAPGTTTDDQDLSAGVRHLLDIDGWAEVDHDPGPWGSDDALRLLEDPDGLVWIVGDQHGIWSVPGDAALRGALGIWDAED